MNTLQMTAAVLVASSLAGPATADKCDWDPYLTPYGQTAILEVFRPGAGSARLTLHTGQIVENTGPLDDGKTIYLVYPELTNGRPRRLHEACGQFRVQAAWKASGRTYVSAIQTYYEPVGPLK